MKLKPWHTDMGITQRGVKTADQLLVLLEQCVDLTADDGMIRRVLIEAIYRKYTLPTLTEDFQRKYWAKNS